MAGSGIDIFSARLLVVDDEPVNVKLLERTLAKAGYQNIESTLDSRQVCDLYEQGQHDLILLDLNMPHMDGFAVMTALRQRFNPTPQVLVLTAQSAQEFRTQALELGARDYVTKPFERNELLHRVSNLLESTLYRQELEKLNLSLEQKVQDRTHELNETRLQIVRRLGRAAEYRDNETGLHIVRMSKTSRLLGAAMGMNEAECELLLNASPMHDIGKIGIPDKVLLKPGKFEPEEWLLMQQHAQIGADILEGESSDLLSMAREIALTHHEKWDGSGYPNGLKGEEIPLVGRICAIADVFDALTSTRPYKKAWSIEDALALINENNGKHFDPAVVAAFMDNLDAILEIRDAYKEPEHE
ncbi:putative two-component system response regulator [Oceanospirillum multiglobuliferum]|uniref:Two-component system response regulator n=1 Tax=Oceanospirillum multiglobuliferum TaxID=64969 RepID=A0A1T4S027_9GAMM|nr:HD domain-containing phosphohydrolase [Oceanospirillum multiglobuliferum]OPX54535.1 two-component system response regulator [Oceanospirillum multiglobuliferum]SKA21629.1 putative two-component system response regulator [Oceanospirillum multiglobuliferum]